MAPFSADEASRTSDQISTREIARRYDRWSPFYDLADALGPLVGKERKWRRLAASKVMDVQGWVLDAACGTGPILGELRWAGFKGKVLGIDASTKMVRKARVRAGAMGGPCWVIAGDVCRLPLKPGSLGGVICAFSITTIADPEAASREFVAAMGPGSRLVVLDSERPGGRIARLFYPALVPISKIFCHTHIDRDIEALLDHTQGLSRVAKTRFAGGLVALYEHVKA